MIMTLICSCLLRMKSGQTCTKSGRTYVYYMNIRPGFHEARPVVDLHSLISGMLLDNICTRFMRSVVNNMLSMICFWLPAWFYCLLRCKIRPGLRYIRPDMCLWYVNPARLPRSQAGRISLHFDFQHAVRYICFRFMRSVVNNMLSMICFRLAAWLSCLLCWKIRPGLQYIRPDICLWYGNPARLPRSQAGVAFHHLIFQHVNNWILPRISNTTTALHGYIIFP